MRQKTFNIGRQGTARRGMTMIEVLIASAIMVLASSVAMSSFIFVARSSKAIRSSAFMASDSLHVQRALKAYATTAERFVLANGNVLQIIQGNGTESRFTYVSSADGNMIIWDPVYGSTTDREIMIRNVKPINGSTPVFALENGSRAVRLRFRIGDRLNNDYDDATTGIGHQSYVVDSLFARRNSAK